MARSLKFTSIIAGLCIPLNAFAADPLGYILVESVKDGLLYASIASLFFCSFVVFRKLQKKKKHILRDVLSTFFVTFIIVTPIGAMYYLYEFFQHAEARNKQVIPFK